MMYRGRIYYNAKQKAEMCDRWQRGESLNKRFQMDKTTRYALTMRVGLGLQFAADSSRLNVSFSRNATLLNLI